MASSKILFVAACAVLLCSAGFAAADASVAVSWLESRQQPGGSFGAWQEHATAAAALALHAWNSSNASLSLAYLSASAENPDSWFYGDWSEADVPGAIDFSLARASQQVNSSVVAENLLPLQNSSSGGFRGYYDFGSGGAVDSGVDTAAALLGLSSLGAMPSANSTSAVAFLSTLQNVDGSFNLTTARSFDSLYSLGPNAASITALGVLALRSAGVADSDGRVQNALAFLRSAAASNFSGSVYAASLAALAFSELNETTSLSQAVSFTASQQHEDGGFADASRSSNASNALDTGFAAYALSFAAPAPSPSPFPTASPSPDPSPSISPSPSINPSPSPTPPPSASGMRVRVFFPSAAGRADVDSQAECFHALDCFSAVASVSCAYYPAVGSLYCAGVSQTCFVTAVNGVAASAASDFWSFEVNGVPASSGVSCYQPVQGDVLALRYVGSYSAPTAAPASSTSQTSSSSASSATPSLSPAQSPSASIAPSLARSKTSPFPTPSPRASPSQTASPSSSSASIPAPALQTGLFAAFDSPTFLVLALFAFALVAALALHALYYRI